MDQLPAAEASFRHRTMCATRSPSPRFPPTDNRTNDPTTDN
jgi:hypothetical protein